MKCWLQKKTRGFCSGKTSIGASSTTGAPLTVTAESSNTNLLPAANIVVAGTGANRTVRLTPSAGIPGTTMVTLTASDGTHGASTQFTLAVFLLTTPRFYRVTVP